jgi:hypothetical protein
MITSKLMLFAEVLIRDADENKVTAVNILDDLLASGFPLALPKLCVLSIVEREPGDPQRIRATMRVVSGEREVMNTDIDIDFQGKTLARTIVVIGNVIVPAPGVLACSLVIDGREIQRYTLRVLPLPPQPTVHPAPPAA